MLFWCPVLAKNLFSRLFDVCCKGAHQSTRFFLSPSKSFEKQIEFPHRLRLFLNTIFEKKEQTTVVSKNRT